VLAAIIAGASLGFLLHNFPPASSFMGDCGANLLGLLMGCLAVEGAVKTEVVLSFVLPLILLAVPFLDTTFVVLKRLKYRRPIYASDSEHFHHRMARIGFSRRRTIAYLYAWTLMLAGFALALRFVPYSDHKGHLRLGWTLAIAALAVLALAASVYLVYVLEILKFRRLDAGCGPRHRLRRSRATSPAIWRPANSRPSPFPPRASAIPARRAGRSIRWTTAVRGSTAESPPPASGSRGRKRRTRALRSAGAARR
jgi:Glycosyl transferase family 4